MLKYIRNNYTRRNTALEKYTTVSVDETSQLGNMLINSLDGVYFVALYGDLGAGKTAFVRGMVQNFLPDAVVTSPTYNIVNTYSDGNMFLHHYDMYRITDEDDLYSVGYFDNLGHGIVVAEWCENIPWALPEKYMKVTILKDADAENVRYIEMELINADSCD
jgi:tRNA threonylcarbamoyladenosine biosynthesis protein TsaE